MEGGWGGKREGRREGEWEGGERGIVAVEPN